MVEKQKSLQKSMAIGAMWMSFLRVVFRLISVISTVILARLLTPDDFGVAAIAMSIFTLISMFSKFGFDTVLIQKVEATADDYNTAWTFNFLFGALSAVLLFSIAPFVGDFYDNEDLESITKVISFMFLLHGARNVGVVDFQKNLTFDREFKLQVIPKLISFFVTIGLAVYYQNYWALVIGNVVWKTVEVTNSYLMHSFRPRFCFKSSAELFGFSKWLMANNFLGIINNHSPELILGKVLSPAAAALYTLANEVGQMVTTEVISNLNRAFYPGYAKVSNELDKLTDLYCGSLRAIAYIVMPLGAGLSLVAVYVVPIMLGNQWLEAIEPLAYIAIAGTVYSLKSNSNYIYLALGKPRISTVELFFRAVVFVISMFVLIPLNGVVGAAQAYLVTALIMFFVSNIILKYVLGLGLFQQARLYVKPLVAVIVMTALVYTFTSFTPINNDFINLFIAVPIGGVSYVFAVYMLWLITGKKVGVETQAYDFVMEKLRRN